LDLEERTGMDKFLTLKELEIAANGVACSINEWGTYSDEELDELARVQAKLDSLIDFLKESQRSGFVLCPYSIFSDSSLDQ
jgi:hypothetical protein